MKVKLPVTWEVCGTVEVEADSIEHAIQVFQETQDHIKLPAPESYVNGSFQLTCDDPDFIATYQNGQD